MNKSKIFWDNIQVQNIFKKYLFTLEGRGGGWTEGAVRCLKTKDYLDITFLLIVIFVFFIFRILSIKFSPGVIKVSKDVVIEYEDERKDETLKK